MDRTPNVMVIELCGVTKGVDDERIDECVLKWLGHIEIRGVIGLFREVYGKSFDKLIEEEVD